MTDKKFSRIKNLLKFAYGNRYSDFYAKKFKQAGFNPLSDFKSIKDIKKIPFLTKKDLLSVNPYKLLFVSEKDTLCIRSTSGTTGKPLYVFYSKLDKIQKWMPKIDYGRILSMNNAINIDQHSIYARNSGYWQANGDIHNLPAAARLAAELEINTLHTSVTMAIVLSDYLREYPILKKSLKRLHLFGELVNPEKRRLIQRLYPGVTILLNYGSTETSMIACQCEYLAKKQDEIYYHPRNDFHHLEIIDPETGKEVKEGEKGEIIITIPYLMGTPIIRYRIGDLVSLTDGKKCPCGFPGPLLQIWGRAGHDVIKAGGFELRREFLERSINNLKAFIEESFEAHIYENFIENKPKIRVEINLSPKKGVEDVIFLKQIIKKELLENWQVSSKLRLKEAIERGLIEPIKINFVDFPTNMKTRKNLILHQE